MTTLYWRILFWGVPAVLLAGTAALTLWGEGGIPARERYRADVASTQRELASLDRENQQLAHEIMLMERDPRIMKRVVADELHWAEEGSVIFDFSTANTEASEAP